MSDKNKKRIKLFLSISLVLIVVFLLGMRISKEMSIEKISYDKIISYVKSNEITKIETKQNSHEIRVTLRDGTENKAIIPSIEEFATFISKEIENGAEIEVLVKKARIQMFVLLSSIIIIFNMSVFILSSSITPRQKVDNVKSEVKFSDVAGIDEEKEQLEEIVRFLKNPQEYDSKGARIPKGILLNGAPGTGKTLLAKAIAGEAGVPFIQVSGSSFEEVYAGLGASRVRKLFKQAKKQAPSIIFIDEIDTVAQKRYSNINSNNEQTLNQLLAEMDGFDSRDNVIVIGATNHIDVLDPAIIRPGRFDRLVFVPMPDVNAREKILEVHARNKQFSKEVSFSEIARKTVGFSGADLENVLNEAAIYTVNHGYETIENEAIDESIARVLAGLKKKNSAITEEDKFLTAVHEAGHAIVSAVVRPNVRNFGISIVPRGNSGGYNFFDESGKTYQRKSDLFNQMQVLYGGRVAEENILGEISSGAYSDFNEASKIAYSMVTKFAMNESFLTQISGEDEFNNELLSSQIKEIESICKEAYGKADSVVKEHRAQLLELANVLMEKEYLSQEEIEDFISKSL